MLWVSLGVSHFSSLGFGCADTYGIGLAPLSEANKDKAAHLEMIRSMQR